MSCDWFCSSTDRQQVQLSVPQTVPDGAKGGDPDERYQLSEEGSGGGVRGGVRGGAREESWEESGTGQMFQHICTV